MITADEAREIMNSAINAYPDNVMSLFKICEDNISSSIKNYAEDGQREIIYWFEDDANRLSEFSAPEWLVLDFVKLGFGVSRAHSGIKGHGIHITWDIEWYGSEQTKNDKEE